MTGSEVSAAAEMKVAGVGRSGLDPPVPCDIGQALHLPEHWFLLLLTGEDPAIFSRVGVG